MPDNFFNDAPTEAPTEAPVEKVKVGEDEYTQEDLQKLVGLGKIGLEAEQKFKTKIDRVWPNYQKVINEKQELETKVKDYEQRLSERVEQRQQQQPAQPLTQEQIRAEAIRQAEELGIGPGAIRKTVMEVVQGQKLLDDISNVIDNMTTDGLPSTTVEDVISHMQETGIRNPEKAYKDMFEKEWLQDQTTKLNSIKQKGIPAVSASVAGSKEPPAVSFKGKSETEISQMISEALSGNYQ